jgi:hypothetical protein
VGEYRIDPSAAAGAVDTGRIFVQFDMYSGDPFNGGAKIMPVGVPSFEMSADASVTVVATPEPAAFLLSLGALFTLACMRLHLLSDRNRPVAR